MKSRGVYRRGDKFCSSISIGDFLVHIGSFDSLKKARKAYDSARDEWYGEFKRPVKPRIRPYGYSQNANGRYKVTITIQGFTVYVGTYDTTIEAANAFDAVYDEWWGK